MENTSRVKSIIATLDRAYNGFIQLQNLSGEDRNRGLRAMSAAIEKSFDEILEANTLDLEMSREMAISPVVLEWLKLTPERLEKTVRILNRIGRVYDPMQRLLNAPYQLDPSQTYCQLMPLGVIALIYEAFPELAVTAAGMCLKTGNSLILRGSAAASNSNNAIAQILQTALAEAKLPLGCLEFLSPEDGSSIQELVTQDRYLNLIIPYGRPNLIEKIAEQATAPVLKTAMGNCYLYWSGTGDFDLARYIILDSHSSQPDPVNAIEKVLVSVNQKSLLLSRMFSSLQEQGFKLLGEKELVAEFPEYLNSMDTNDWSKPYLDKTIAFKIVNNIEDAIAWIDRYSSHHADCLVTQSYEESRQFAREIDSALVFINSSPRFSRNPQRGESVFLGMSNQKGNRRGLIGLETFTTLKQIVQGDS
jgi:glutamate-5-semialdehyde dehydrogenase